MQIRLPALAILGAFLAGPAPANSAPGSNKTPSTRPAGSNTYTLEQCIHIALHENPLLSAAQWDATAAAERWKQARGRRWPAIDATAGYTRHLDNTRLLPPGKPMDPGAYGNDIFDAGIRLSLPPYPGGRISDEIAAAQLLAAAAGHRLVRSRRALVYRVSRTYFDILGQRRVIASLEMSRKAIEEHRKRIQDMLDVQKAARVDLLRVEVRLADLTQRLVAENNRLRILNRVMATLMGLPPERSHIQITGELSKQTAPPPDESKSYRQALGRRADYRAALAQVDAAERQVAAARAQRFPTIGIQGSYGELWAANADIRQPGAGEAGDVGMIGVRLDIPVFEGGRIMARIREQRARLAAARERLNQLELQIRLEVQTAILNIRANLERVKATEQSILQADESLRIERQKYTVGKGSITDVLDAQSALLAAQTSYYRALAGYHASVAEWRLAVGMPGIH